MNVIKKEAFLRQKQWRVISHIVYWRLSVMITWVYWLEDSLWAGGYQRTPHNHANKNSLFKINRQMTTQDAQCGAHLSYGFTIQCKDITLDWIFYTVDHSNEIRL